MLIIFSWIVALLSAVLTVAILPWICRYFCISMFCRALNSPHRFSSVPGTICHYIDKQLRVLSVDCGALLPRAGCNILKTFSYLEIDALVHSSSHIAFRLHLVSSVNDTYHLLPCVCSCGHAQSICFHYKSRFMACVVWAVCLSAKVGFVHTHLTVNSKISGSGYDCFQVGLCIHSIASYWEISVANTVHTASRISPSAASTSRG